MLFGLKDKLYSRLVTANAEATAHYEGYKDSNPDYHSKHRIRSWKFLMALNKYYKNGKKGDFPKPPKDYYVKGSGIFVSSLRQEPKALPSGGILYETIREEEQSALPESMLKPRVTPVQLSKQLMEYDVISFDIFDTLILRPFASPFDLFDVVGAKLGIADFKTLRRMAESKAREETTKGNFQVDIYDIYKMLGQYVEIDEEKAIRIEIETEKEFCFANPYMKQVFSILKKNGKTIIAVSDMYLPQAVIGELLSSCGYEGFADIFVSCDHQAGKANGKLQTVAQEKIGLGKKYAHIGDALETDVKASRKIGWAAYHYVNVNSITANRRTGLQNTLDASYYKGIINAYVQCGLMKRTPYYEHGFIHGGVLTAGYCQFLDKLAKREGIDKFFFVARDCNIVYKIYSEYFGTAKSEYIMWSRVAAGQLTFEDFTREFVMNLIQTRVSDTDPLTVEQILTECDLLFLEEKAKEAGFKMDRKINNSAFRSFEKFIYQNRSYISAEFNKIKSTVKAYFEPMLKDCKKICIADIGWRGTSIVQMKCLLEELFPGIEIRLALAGMSSRVFNNTAMIRKDINVYLFSDNLNVEMQKMHFDSTMPFNNAMIEILFGAPHSSFLKFEKSDSYSMRFSDSEIVNIDISREIQKGICDFVKMFKKHTAGYDRYFEISPYTAYLQAYSMLRNKDYIKALFKDYEMTLVAGIYSGSRIKTIGELMEEEG